MKTLLTDTRKSALQENWQQAQKHLEPLQRQTFYEWLKCSLESEEHFWYNDDERQYLEPEEIEEYLDWAKEIDLALGRQTIAEKLYNRRVALKMTQKETAVKAGISERALQGLENESFSPRLDLILRLCYALDMDLQLTDKVNAK